MAAHGSARQHTEQLSQSEKMAPYSPFCHVHPPTPSLLTYSSIVTVSQKLKFPAFVVSDSQQEVFIFLTDEDFLF